MNKFMNKNSCYNFKYKTGTNSKAGLKYVCSLIVLS